MTVTLRRWSLAVSALAGLVGAQGCALEEIQIATGESMLVVQAVMRPDRNLQYVVVERSFSGEIVIDEFDAGNIPPNVPQIPVSGASVRILNLDFVDDPCANFAELKEVNLVAGVYATRLNCPTMRVGDRLELTVLTVDGEVFRAGRHYRLTVAATDTNFFDFARSQNNRVTGRGFINRLTGGVGVFGSLVATGIHITAIGETDDPREGVYRLEGVVQGVTIDAVLTVYLRHQLQDTEFSAFLEGDWITLTQLGVWIPWNTPPINVDGEFAGQQMTTTSQLFSLGPTSATMEGIRSPGAPFDLELLWDIGINVRVLGTVTATQQ